MDKKIQPVTPDYKRIYTDILEKKHPEKTDHCKVILKKEKLSVLDILELNRKIFGITDRETEKINGRHKSYNKSAILHILNYQRKNNYKNIEVARHFKISRNTITKWKKIFS